MTDTTLEVRESFAKALAEVSQAADLDKIRVEYLGKKGLVTDLMKDMKSLSIEEKKTFGQAVNVLKDEITAAIAAYQSASGQPNLPFRVVSFTRKNNASGWMGNSADNQ